MSSQGSFQEKEAGRRVREDMTPEAEAGVVQLLFLRWKEEGCEPSNAGSSRSWKKPPLEAPEEMQSC